MSRTDRLQKLPAAQEAALPEIRDKWLAVGLRTGAGDRQRAWDGVRHAYETAGRARPTYHLWMDSPLAALLACGILRTQAVIAQVRAQVHAQVIAQVHDQVIDQVHDQVSDQVIDQVIAQVRAQVHAQVIDQVIAQVIDQVSAQVRAQVSAQVSAQVIDQVSAQVHDQVIAQVRAQVRAQVSAQVSAQVIAQVHDQVIAQVRDQVSAQVRAQVIDQVSAQVHDQVSDQVIDQVSDLDDRNRAIAAAAAEFRWLWWMPGQFDAGWHSFYDALRDYCDIQKLHGLREVAESCAYAMMFPDIVVFCAPPVAIHRDDRGRLHHESEMACRFADGWGLFMWHGARVERDLIEHPERITTQQIVDESNAEIRRIMIDRYGTERFMRDVGAVRVQADDYGELFRVELDDDEPLVMVRGDNATAEPDGTFKSYMIRVPPAMTSAREAWAWTFALDRADTYAPTIQT